MKKALLIPVQEHSEFPLFCDQPESEGYVNTPDPRGGLLCWQVVARENYGDVVEVIYIHPWGESVPPREEWDSYQSFVRSPEQQISVALDADGNYLTLTIHVAPNGHQRPEPRLLQYHQVKEGASLMRAEPTDWVLSELRSYMPHQPDSLWARVNLVTYTKVSEMAVAA